MCLLPFGRHAQARLDYPHIAGSFTTLQKAPAIIPWLLGVPLTIVLLVMVFGVL
jgi:hypothetical protein